MMISSSPLGRVGEAIGSFLQDRRRTDFLGFPSGSMYSSEEKTPLLLERAGGDGGKTACIAVAVAPSPSCRAEDEAYPELAKDTKQKLLE